MRRLFLRFEDFEGFLAAVSGGAPSDLAGPAIQSEPS
jgi:hypothetical protein